jgi:predicted MFS family arabinose efflux permease
MRPSAAAAVASGANLTLLLCFALNMVGRGVSDSYPVFLVPLGDDFQWSRKDLTGVYSTAQLVFSAAAPFAGLLLARFGYRTIYLTGLASLAAGMLLASTITRLAEVYLYVGVTGGIALATMGMVPASSLLREWYSAKLPVAIGIAYTGLGFGTLVVVPASQWLIDTLGWRGAYRTLGIVLAALTVVVALLPWRRIAAGVAVAARAATPAPSVRALVREMRRATRRPVFWGLASVFFFTSIGMYLMMVQSVAYLISTGIAPLAAASVMGIVGMLSLVGMVASGWLASRIGYATTGVATFAVTLAGLAMMAWLAHSPPAFALAAFVALFGVSQGTRGPMIATVATREFPGHSAGPVFGCIASAGGIGGAIGAWLAGFLYDAAGTYEPSFVLAGASFVLAAVPFAVFREFRRPRGALPHPTR